MKSDVLQHSPLVNLLISIKPDLPKKMQMANVTKSMANTIASTHHKEILICHMYDVWKKRAHFQYEKQTSRHT